MMELEELAKGYIGRFIIVGFDTEGVAVATYGITGRKPSSQKRRLVYTDGKVAVEPTESAGGNPDLLFYTAMAYRSGKILIANGEQMGSLIHNNFVYSGHTPCDGLLIDGWSYERDDHDTPRIQGSLTVKGGKLSIVKCPKPGWDEGHYFTVPDIPGRGKLISTYAGENVDPLPSFHGEPISVPITGTSVQEIAHHVYDSFAPQDGKDDLRVAVVTMRIDSPTPRPYIVNRVDISE